MLAAALPNSFDSDGISMAARHGPFVASVPYRSGVEPPPNSLPLSNTTLRELHSSGFHDRGKDNVLASSSPSSGADGTLTLPKRPLRSDELRTPERSVGSDGEPIDVEIGTESVVHQYRSNSASSATVMHRFAFVTHLGTKLPTQSFEYSDTDGNGPDQEGLPPSKPWKLTPKTKWLATSLSNHDDETTPTSISAPIQIDPQLGEDASKDLHGSTFGDGLSSSSVGVSASPPTSNNIPIAEDVTAASTPAVCLEEPSVHSDSQDYDEHSEENLNCCDDLFPFLQEHLPERRSCEPNSSPCSSESLESHDTNHDASCSGGENQTSLGHPQDLISELASAASGAGSNSISGSSSAAGARNDSAKTTSEVFNLKRNGNDDTGEGRKRPGKSQKLEDWMPLNQHVVKEMIPCIDPLCIGKNPSISVWL